MQAEMLCWLCSRSRLLSAGVPLVWCWPSVDQKLVVPLVTHIFERIRQSLAHYPQSQSPSVRFSRLAPQRGMEMFGRAA
uniref:Putative secreted protein n=1 Tax=Anopheles darlingi TaxID=43151 RepID=A0A2M4DGS3_ANODA